MATAVTIDLGPDSVHDEQAFRKALEAYLTAANIFRRNWPQFEDNAEQLAAEDAKQEECNLWGKALDRLKDMVLENHGHRPEVRLDLEALAIDIGDCLIVLCGDHYDGRDTVHFGLMPRSPEMRKLVDRAKWKAPAAKQGVAP
jgi:hypothetical protein